MVKHYLKLEDLKAYMIAFGLANDVWKVVSAWDNFNKFSLGRQFTEAVDSISANIAEGFGRYHKKDKVKFYYNARGSAFESFDWLRKAKVRLLISDVQEVTIRNELARLPQEINGLIKYTNDRLTI